MRNGNTKELFGQLFGAVYAGRLGSVNSLLMGTTDLLDEERAPYRLPHATTLYRRLSHLTEGNAHLPAVEAAVVTLRLLCEKTGSTHVRLALDEEVQATTGKNWMTHPGEKVSEVGQRAVMTKKMLKRFKQWKDRGLSMPKNDDFLNKGDYGVELLRLMAKVDGGHRLPVCVRAHPGPGHTKAQLIELFQDAIAAIKKGLGPGITVSFVADRGWDDDVSADAMQASGADFWTVRAKITGQLHSRKANFDTKRAMRLKLEGRKPLNRKEAAHRWFPVSIPRPGHRHEFVAWEPAKMDMKSGTTRTRIFHYVRKRTSSGRLVEIKPGEELVLWTHMTARILFSNRPPTKDGALAAVDDYDGRWDLSEEGVRQSRKFSTKGSGWTMRSILIHANLGCMIQSAAAWFQTVRESRAKHGTRFLKTFVNAIITWVTEAFGTLLRLALGQGDPAPPPIA
jgi:hypothetical protein